MSDDRIVVDFDNEPEEEKISNNTKTYGVVNTKVDKLVITLDDLDNEPINTGKTFGNVPNYNNTIAYQKKGKSISKNSLLYYAVAGAIGGFLAFAVSEPFVNESVKQASGGLLGMGLFGGVLGGLIAACLSCVDDFKSLVIEKLITHFFTGLLVGFGTGFFGGVFGQLIYGGMNSTSDNLALQIISRVLGWAIVGAFIGLSQSLVDFKLNQKRLINGLIGGVCGGAVAGLLFDPIGMVTAALGAKTGIFSRLIGLVVTGVCVGVAISYISEMAKQAWVYIVDGLLAGKQFIIYETNTRFGSSPKCEITIVKDLNIEPIHFEIQNFQTSYKINAIAPTTLNGVPVTSAVLKNGDIIKAGNTSFRYEENEITKSIY